MISRSPKPDASPFALTRRDYDWLESDSYIAPRYADEAELWRADSITGANTVGRIPTALEDMSGIVFNYWHPLTLLLRERVIRLDHPIGKMKYVGPIIRTNMLYIPNGVTRELMLDPSTRKVFVEGEKKAIALWRIARQDMSNGKPTFIPIGLRGVWGWRGVTENVEMPNGGHNRAKGPLNDFDFFNWEGCEVIIFYDSNIHSPKPETRNSIMAARKGLADHLYYILKARVLYAEMSREHFELGLNGPDNLAATDGPDAILRLLDDAYQAFSVRDYTPRAKLSPEERRGQANALRDVASKNAEAKAADVLGSKAAKNLARLWSEANLSAESRDLLFTLETMAEGRDDVKFYYADLYPLLYKCSGDEFEQTPSGGYTLKSSARKRLRDRFEKLSKDEAKACITFADFTAGHKEDGENLPSHVRLLSRGYVAEVMIMAEDEQGYSRHKKASRDRAFIRFTQEQSGRAYIHKQPKRKDRNKQIAAGWKRVQGNITATIERMRQRGDSEESIWRTMAEFVPSEFLAFIAAFLSDLKNIANPRDSANNSARFPKTCKDEQPKFASDPAAVEIWNSIVERSKGKRSLDAKVEQ